jgi:hypothetical protein
LKIIIHSTKGREKYLKDCVESCKESGIEPTVLLNAPEEDKLEMNIQKAAHGFYRALTHDIYNDCLILEDDVVLNPGWWTILTETRKLIKQNKYMISLILPFPEIVGAPDVKMQTMQPVLYRATISFDRRGEPQSTPILYSNTSAIFFSKLTLQTRLAEFIYRYSVKGNSMYDMAFGNFIFRSQLQMFVMVPSIAKNVGDITSIDPTEARSHGQGYDDWPHPYKL